MSLAACLRSITALIYLSESVDYTTALFFAQTALRRSVIMIRPSRTTCSPNYKTGNKKKPLHSSSSCCTINKSRCGFRCSGPPFCSHGQPATLCIHLRTPLHLYIPRLITARSIKWEQRPHYQSWNCPSCFHFFLLFAYERKLTVRGTRWVKWDVFGRALWLLKGWCLVPAIDGAFASHSGNGTLLKVDSTQSQQGDIDYHLLPGWVTGITEA